MSAVVAVPTGTGRFQTRLDVPGGAILSDEPVDVGGLGSGPTPYQLLSAALAACTSMTLRLYAERSFRTLTVHQTSGASDRKSRPAGHGR
jgi:putative redox protein